MSFTPRALIVRAERLLAAASKNRGLERPSLVSFLFHGLFEHEEDADSGIMDPQQRMTVSRFERFLSLLSNQGFCFVSPQDIISGKLSSNKNYALITFDDGYQSSRLALPILEAHMAPAIFFVSTDNVMTGRGFWWDTVYRERNKRGVSESEIAKEQDALKLRCHEDIERHLITNFGVASLDPDCEVDRPLTPAELKQLSHHDLAILGNHTRHHAILTNYPRSGIESEIQGAQEDMEELTGLIPSAISYPNGNHSSLVIDVTLETPGIELGITTIHQKNRIPLPVQNGAMLQLSRFTVWGTDDLLGQVIRCRGEISIYGLMQRIRRQFRK